MPREALQDLALAVLRYDQAVRRIRKERPGGPSEQPVALYCVDPDELYDEMLDLAREAVQSNLLPR